jgi:hypothetical protein
MMRTRMKTTAMQMVVSKHSEDSGYQDNWAYQVNKAYSFLKHKNLNKEKESRRY